MPSSGRPRCEDPPCSPTTHTHTPAGIDTLTNTDTLAGIATLTDAATMADTDLLADTGGTAQPTLRCHNWPLMQAGGALRVVASNGAVNGTASIERVAHGDVWFCSGQVRQHMLLVN